jgi:acyl-CoA thioesterase I
MLWGKGIYSSSGYQSMTLKIHRLLAVLPLIITSVCLSACSSGVKLPRLADDAVILAFGDSLTFGTGAQPAESYPAVLEQLIGRRVVNSGVPGEVTEQGLSRLPAVLENEKPALLILCHGGNDLLRHLGKQQTIDNLRAMIKVAKERGAKVVMIAVPSPSILLSPPSFYREIASDMMVRIAERALTDVLSDGTLKSDYIHPNAAGYRKLAYSIADLLKKSGAIEAYLSVR